jgi:methylmalonyl-CoA/ethylmalonyl-CoA epimerase
MKIEGLLKVGIAVKDLSKAVDCFAEILGMAPGEIVTYEPYEVRYCLFELGDFFLELMEPTTANGPIAKFIETHGEGLQHLSIRVSNIEEAMAELKEKGFRFVQEAPVRENVAFGTAKFTFLQPQFCHGVLLQLVEVQQATNTC